MHHQFALEETTLIFRCKYARKIATAQRTVIFYPNIYVDLRQVSGRLCDALSILVDSIPRSLQSRVRICIFLPR